MKITVERIEQPGAEQHRAIAALLETYNDEAGGPDADRPLALVLRDADGGVQGGLWGRSYWRWLFVELLVVAPACRGQGLGRRLMAAAEAEARARDCVGIWLDTFSFQAPDFYAGLGFREFGRIPEYPPGRVRHFLLKRLAPDR